MGEIKGLEMDEKKLSSPKPPCHGGLCIEIPDYSMKQDFGPMLNMQHVTRLRGVGVKNLLPLAESSQKKEALQKSIEKSKIGREDTAERAALTEELAALRKKKEQLKAEIDKYRECDPDVVEEMRQTNKIAKEAANRWTDNIFAIKSWAKRKFGFEESRIDKSFGIPEDFDYID
ncbi:meiotic nuclear division protein 1 homolog isoform X3 [Anas platyrhynchos]|uniref:meiotic nuclear division protein 1 homolog isoform X3 n=1 Tax=Anas platyrhynchos TaxID=8839 RepID=UPI003AF2658C